MTRPADGLLSAYVGLTRLAAPLGRLVVALRRRRGKEHPERWAERLGDPGADVESDTATVWIHAASVGETVAALPLVDRIAGTGVRVVLTTVTTTSAAVAASRLPAGVVHRFVPLDVAPFMDRFLTTWKPGLAIFVESEVWPVAVARLAAAETPLVVLNARMSDRSFRGWSRFPRVAAAIFGRVGLCLAQSADDADRFRALGAPRVVDVGNIKFDAPVPEAEPEAAAALGAALAGRPMFLAASTHPGEEAFVFDAFGRLQASVDRLALVIAPRHPDRGPEIAEMAAARGFTVERRGGGGLPSPVTDVYVADTVGELGTLYRLADAAFVGGSLVPFGGHNPIEPVRLGAPVVSGPHVGSFRDAFAALQAAGGVAMVDDAAGLAAEVAALIGDPSARARLTTAAGEVVARYTGALDRTFRMVEPLLAAMAVEARLTPMEEDW
ncbi:MAG TPA: 3-deoxy-D-manno-octulosonic acid transferase [Methylomirabilota bacterium]|nr:3-deoxy-D-manno-octulosonic acid transferase [Methylomirabilota bacterium]